MKDSRFKFWVPAEIEKGTEKKTGKDIWKFKGIASTADKDTDEEILLPAGFDLSYFLSDGFVNWNHQSKNNPSAIIGEPTFAEIRPEGMYVETELYQDSPVAKSVWELGGILDKANSNRKLGFSIEGKVMERDPNDEKKITKAKITGLAITPSPKNKSTFADICKGEFEFDNEWEFELIKGEDQLNPDGGDTLYIVDITDQDGNRVTVDKGLNIKIMKKSLDTGAGAPVTPSTFSNANPHFKPDNKNLKNISLTDFDSSKQSDNLNKKLSKAGVYERIFLEVTSDIEKAEKIYNLIEGIELKNNPNMEIKTISLDTINKAYGALGIDLEKGSSNDLAGMTNAKADTNPAIADGDKDMPGNENGYTTEMVMGLFKSMDKSSKKEMMEKAIEKGISSKMADKAYNKALEKGIIKADDDSDNDDEDEDDEDDSDDDEESDDAVAKAEEAFNKAKEDYEAIKAKGKKKVKETPVPAKEKPKKNKVEKSLNNDIVKALTETGNALKSVVEQNNELSKALLNQKEEFSKKFEELASMPNGRRSVATSQFMEKAMTDTIKKAEGEGKTVLNLDKPKDSKSFLNMLEKAAFGDIQKGGVENKFFSNVMAQMELGPSIAIATLKSPGVLEKIESELNVKILATV